METGLDTDGAAAVLASGAKSFCLLFTEGEGEDKLAVAVVGVDIAPVGDFDFRPNDNGERFLGAGTTGFVVGDTTI